ncbi:unnamed protein product [Thlaspi arvense]|uniref:Uncharacterized protein n=1 Tax=Thlaspi arvense TaxID=13288 RepID=A0AAU9RND3_THLAR|nr:unnamed protein product [Thlaspi arvense]
MHTNNDIPPGAVRSRSTSGPPTPPGDFGSTSASGPVMPPVAVGPTSAGAANNYTHMTLEALMNAPSREFQPHLHPRKLNGALWQMVEFGLDEPPPYINLVRKTHMRSDRCFINGRSETLVLEHSMTSQGEYTELAVCRRNFILTKSIHASLTHSVDMDMRISSLEARSESVNNNVETLKSNMTEFKQDVVAMKGELKEELATVMNEIVAVLNVFLQKVETTPPPPAAAPTPSPLFAKASTHFSPLVKTTNPTQEQSPLDKWCAALLGE